jgi:hypothetical protein
MPKVAFSPGGAVALPGEFGEGLRVVVWRAPLPLCGAAGGHKVLIWPSMEGGVGRMDAGCL